MHRPHPLHKMRLALVADLLRAHPEWAGILAPSMERRFFDLNIDVYVPGRWYLAEPRNRDGQQIEDIWQFIDGKRVEDPGSLRIPIDEELKQALELTGIVGGRFDEV